MKNTKLYLLIFLSLGILLTNQNYMRHIITVCLVTLISFSCSQNISEEKNSVKDSTTISQDSSLQKTDTVPTTAALSLIPLQTEGDQGQVTFVQAGKTIFYYNHKTKKGIVNVNGTEYTLDKFLFDSNTNSYTLSGGQVKIVASNFKYVDDEGSGDCHYGNAPFATITSGNAVLKMDKIEVQDCPDY